MKGTVDMNIKVHKNPDKLQEIISLIYAVFHEQDYKEEMNSLYQHISIDKKQFDRKYYTKIKKYLNKFKKECTIDKSWEDVYFRKSGSTDKEIASVMIMNWDIDSFRKINKDENAFSIDFYRNKILYAVRQNYEDLQTKNQDIFEEAVKNNTMEGFVDFISQIDISSETKWNYIEMYNNPKKYFTELSRIVFMNENAYDDAYDDIKDYINEYMDQFEKKLEDNIKEFEDNIGLIIDKEKYTDLYPMITRNRELSYMKTESRESNIYYIGILVQKCIKIQRADSTDGKYLYSLMKNLGDKSKFEILTLLKDKEMYGQQIAEALNLTTATISYHMNDLVVCNFVQVYRTDTKIYYSLNKEVIKKFISDLDQYFK